MPTDRDKDEAPLPRVKSRSGTTLLVVVVVVVVTVAVVLGGRIFYNAQRNAILTQKNAELVAVRDLKIGQIVEWRHRLLADGKAAADNPVLFNELAAWTSGPSGGGASAPLTGWLDTAVTDLGYESAVLLSADGSQWLGSAGVTAPSARDRELARAAVRSGETTLTDLFLDSATGKPALDVVAPMNAGGGKPLGALVLHRDPSRDLYPLIQSWPTPSPTAETLLVRRDGNNVLYLNDLRFSKNAALKQRIPLTDSPLLAVQALTGGPRVINGVDYQGNPVLGAVGSVGDSSWHIVAKVSGAEVDAPILSIQRTTTVGALLVLAFAGLGLALAWRQRTHIFYRQQLESERAQHELATQYDYLTRYANDAIILSDERFGIVHANERAVEMYGYDMDSLLTMTLDDLQDPATPPSERLGVIVQREPGQLVEAKQVRRDGTVLDVEASSRVIDTDDGRLNLAVIRDITERKLTEATLRTSQLRFTTFMNANPSLAWMKDGRGGYVYGNKAWLETYGVSLTESLGKTDSDLMPADVADAVRNEDLEVIRTGQTVEGTKVTGEGDDQRLWRTIRFPFTDLVGQTLVGGIAIDITEQARIEEELRDRTDNLLRSNADLEKFAYVASHDLQEPLRSVVGYAQLLQRRYAGKLDSDADEFIGFMVEGANRMSKLITDILAYSRVGAAGVRLEEVDLDHVLRDVLEALKDAIAQNGAVVTHDEMPTLKCDRVQIGQILQNLLSNALKFHGDEPPVIHIGATKTDGYWEFTVRDNGIGVDPEYFDRVFVIFQRLESRALYPGTGMGLAICKRIVEQHGGRIWLESQPGEGSTFHFTLPDTKEGQPDDRLA